MDYFLCVNEKYGREHSYVTIADLQRRYPTQAFELMRCRNGKSYIIERVSPIPGDIRIVAVENRHSLQQKPQPVVVIQQAYLGSRYLDWHR